MSEYRLNLVKFDGRATFRTHERDDDPIHEFVQLSLDRDRFNALGKPGYIDVTVTAAPAETPDGFAKCPRCYPKEMSA